MLFMSVCLHSFFFPLQESLPTIEQLQHELNEAAAEIEERKCK
jgi:hypothetical protein